MNVSRVLFVSHTYPSGYFRVGSHHLAREMAGMGLEVVHVSTSLSVIHRAMRRGTPEQLQALRASGWSVREGVRDVIPQTLLPIKYWRQPSWPAVLRSFGWQLADLTFIDEPMMWSRSLREVSRRLIYRPTDLYPDGVKHRRQSDLLKRVDAVVATSRTVLQELGSLSLPHRVIENGVDYAKFANSSVWRPKVATYVGALDSRFDWPTVRSLAAAFGDWTFAIYGPGSCEIPMPSNVEMKGPVAYEKAPTVLAQSRVGLLPLSSDPLNAGRSPMKLYEYLAAGLTVVSRSTSGIISGSKPGVFTYDSTQSALEAFASAADLSASADFAEGKRAAAEQDWSRKARELLGFACSV